MAVARRTTAGQRAEECTLASRFDIFSRNHSSRELETMIFHQPCPDCLSFGGRNQHLCGICQHWRFQHLFKHLLNADRCRDIPKIGMVELKEADGLKLSNGCTFCDMVRHSLEIHAKYSKGKASEISNDKYPSVTIFLDGSSEHFTIIVEHNLVFDSSQWIHVWDPVNVPDCVRTHIQWSLVNKWPVECTKKHDKCRNQYLEQPDGILLVDVQRRKLVKANENCKFVALSYVWGANPNPDRLTCTKSNAEDLKEDGALKAEELPRTIEDALQVCKNLGENYLWVDRLCIVQDDKYQKHDQIEAMAKIFSSAFLVIVVLDGDMEAGIPGVTSGRSEMQKQMEIAGMVFINRLPDPGRLIDHSDWAKRGWTYQEAVLARRKLYFSRVQVFHECNTDVREEDPVVTTGNWSRRSALTESGWSFDKWKDHISLYTTRSLSHPSDIYNAIAGISNALLPQSGSWLYGLPRRNFDEALLWINYLEEGYRKSDKVLLPRWSWSSVNGKITYQREKSYLIERPFYAGTFVVWKHQENECGFPESVPVRDSKFVAWVRAREDSLRVIHSERDPESVQDAGNGLSGLKATPPTIYDPGDDRGFLQLLCLGIAWSQGCIDAKWPFPALTELTFRELGERLQKRWQEVDDLERYIALSAPQEQQTLVAGVEMPLDRCTLKGRAQISSFGFTQWSKNVWTIVDNEGRPSGKLDKNEKAKAEAGLTFWPSCKYQLIALSIGFFGEPFRIGYGSRISTADDPFVVNDPGAEHLWNEVYYNRGGVGPFCEAVGPNGLDLSYIDSEGSALKFIPIVHVMLAEWNGPVARRISIGWIFLTRWVKSNPQFKTVYLA